LKGRAFPALPRRGEEFGDALERAIKRSGKVIEAQAIRALQSASCAVPDIEFKESV
jgi:hypothetical protein